MSRGVSACSFAAGWLLAGMTAWPIGWLSLDRCRVRASGRAGQGPGGARPRSGAAGVLEAPVREPKMAGAGKGRGRVCGLCGYGRPIAGCPAGRPAGCLHPFGCAPAWRAGGHGAVRVQGRAGPITFPFPPAGLVPAAAGSTRLPGRAPVRAGSSHCLADGAADMPVAQAVEHLGQHDPRGGGLGDAAGVGAAAGDDRLLDLTRLRPGRGPLDRLDQRPAQHRDPCLDTRPRITRVSDS